MQSTVKRLLSSTSLIVSIAFLRISESTLASNGISEESENQKSQRASPSTVASSSSSGSIDELSSPQVVQLPLTKILKGLIDKKVPFIKRLKSIVPEDY